VACALNGSVAEIIFDMTGQNYLTKPDFSSIVLSYNEGSIYADPPLHILTLNLTGEGSVSVDGTTYTEQLIVNSGTSLELMASPAEGWLFNGWSGDFSGTDNPLNVLMDDHKNITATFTLKTYTIHATAGPNGGISPSGDVVVNHGASQSFTITPDTGYHIADVLVNGSSVGTPAEYTFNNVTDQHTIQASFAINQYTIDVSASPQAGGTVDGGGTYEHNESVTLTASPSPGYVFVNWTEDGAEVSTSTEYVFNATSSRTLLANFEEIPPQMYTLTVTILGSGDVTVDGGAYILPVDVEEGITLNLNAISGAGYEFVGWSGDLVSTSNAESILMDDDKNITASFAINQYTIDVSVSPAVGGTVDGGGTYEHNESVTLTASPSPGYVFVNWTEDSAEVSTSTEYVFNATSSRTLVANFAEIPPQMYTLTITILGSGDVTVNGGAYILPVDVEEGITLNLNAIADAGYEFVSWSGDLVSTSNEESILMDDDKNITATFTFKTYTIQATAGPNGGISPSGDVVVNHGASPGFTITPNAGYHIANVLVDGESVGTPAEYTFNNVTHHHTIQASFAINTYTINASASPAGGGTVSGAGTYNHGTTVNLSASANPGYAFVNWTEIGTAVSSNPNYSFEATASRTLVAHFELLTYAVAFNVASGIGSLAAAVDGTPITSGASVDYGSEVVFTAAPGEGYSVQQWTLNGNIVNEQNPDSYTVTELDENITVTVAFEAIPYTLDIAVVPEGAGTVTLNPDKAFYTTGEMISLLASPNTGFDFLHWLDNGKSILSADNPYEYTMLAQNASLSAVFTVSQHTITATAGANGSITPAGDVVVEHGSSQSFTITPADGYLIADVLVDGESVGTPGSYTFESVTQSHTIHATFTIKTYTIQATAGLNGSISPSGDVVVNHGASQGFTITPNAGYHIADVLVNGSSVGTPAEYTFNNVTDHHTIHASFAINTYTINASASPAAGGTVSGAGTYNHGTTVNLSASANPGYAFVNWTEIGTAVSSNPNYSFEATASRTLVAHFELLTYTVAFNVASGIGSLAAVVDGTPITSGALVDYGSEVVFTAAPGDGYSVQQWTLNGNIVNEQNPDSYTVTDLDENITVAVAFEAIPYTLDVAVVPEGAGTVTLNPDKAFYTTGEMISLSASPNTGFDFLHWLDNGKSILSADNPYEYTMLAQNASLSAVFTVSQHTITATAGANGSITPAGDVVVEHGTSQSFTITPADGYLIADVLVDGESVGTPGSYTFESVTQSHTIHAIFIIKTYSITATVGANGNITPAGDVVVEHGASQGFTITPADGYLIADALVDGESVGAMGSYTFESVTQSHTIHASFAINKYTIHATAGPNGSISPSGDVVVNHGASQSFTITPSAGYHIADVLVDGESVGAVTSYTFENISCSQTIHATFAINTYTIHASASPAAGGTVSGAGTYNHGTTVNLSASANPGYAFVNWTEIGTAVSSNPNYSFEATASRTLVANFEEITYTLTFDIRNASAKPINDATITLNGTSNPEGNYVFSGLTAGEYDYTVITLGYQVFTGDVSVLDDITVDVTLQLLTHTVTFGVTGGNGSLTASADGTSINSGDAVDHGSDLLFNATPNTGYRVKEWKLNGSVVAGHTETTLTVEAIDDAVNVSVGFEEIPPEHYTIRATAGPNGGISPSGDVVVNHGASQGFTITPDTGYHIADVLVNGSSVGTPGSYTFENVTQSHTIHASFAINKYTIHATAGPNGGISPSGDVVVNHGASQGFTITPDTGYHIADVLVDGESVGAVTSYTFENISCSHTIHASFSINTYTIEVSASPQAGGTVEGGGTYNHDELVTLTASANPDYVFVSWTEHGTEVSANTTYSFTATSSRTLLANFEEIPPQMYTLTITILGSGDVTVNGGAYILPVDVEEGITLNLNAIAGTNYEFVGWSGDIVSTSNEESILMDDDKNITASFTELPPQQHTIHATSGSNGSIAPEGDIVVEHGASQSFTITPNAGYHIADVLVNDASIGAATSYNFGNVSRSHTIHASFSINTYTIEVSASPQAGGTIEGGGTYNHGELVTLTASANPDYVFVNWTADGAQVSASAEYVFDATSSRTLLANFEEIPPQMYTLTVTTVGSGSVSVDGTTYTVPVTVEEGTTLNLTAIAGTNYEFSGWSGDMSGTDSSSSILMNGNKDVTATFTESNTSAETISYSTNNLAFKIFPNPTKAIFSFQTEGCPGDEEIRVDILDLTGRIVLSKRLDAGKTVHSFSLEQQHPGIYLIRVICGGQVSTKRLIKQ
jgi:uncharacterized repeat protein (TIGR02543 family)